MSHLTHDRHHYVLSHKHRCVNFLPRHCWKKCTNLPKFSDSPIHPLRYLFVHTVSWYFAFESTLCAATVGNLGNREFFVRSFSSWMRLIFTSNHLVFFLDKFLTHLPVACDMHTWNMWNITENRARFVVFRWLCFVWFCFVMKTLKDSHVLSTTEEFLLTNRHAFCLVHRVYARPPSEWCRSPLLMEEKSTKTVLWFFFWEPHQSDQCSIFIVSF